MPGLLIVAHAPLASALQQVAAHPCLAPICHIEAVDVLPSWDQDQVERATRLALAAFVEPENSVLILADIPGATPSNGALRVADGVNVRLVTGVNVPMLWRVLCYAQRPLDALVEIAVDGGRLGVMQCGPQPPQHQSVHVLPHDQTNSHHQQ